MRMMGVALLVLAMAPVPAAAAVMLQSGASKAPACHLDSPACEPIASAPIGTSGESLPDPAIAAIVGLAMLGLAVGRRRSGLAQVVS